MRPGGSAASADNTVFVNTDTEISVNNQHIPYILQKDGGIKFTIKNGGAVLYLSSAESGNIITVIFGSVGTKKLAKDKAPLKKL